MLLEPQIETVEAPPPAPAPPVRPAIREYQWQSSDNDSNATTFSIVSKDGLNESATAVWVQDDALCFFKPDGNRGRMPIASIDRQGTLQMNAAKGLKLSLPPES